MLKRPIDFFWKIKALLILCFYSGKRGFDDWREHIYGQDIDYYYCCNGRDCGCYAVSIKDNYDNHLLKR